MRRATARRIHLVAALALVGAALTLEACASAPRDRAVPPATPRPDTTVRRDTGDLAARPASALDERQLRDNANRQVEEMLIGRFPGVTVLRGANGGLHVRIRGATTIMGNAAPLYVVNGMPVEPGPDGLIFLNPYDIARIEVLKDAGQTAFYGVRGANGVILITTKKELQR